MTNGSVHISVFGKTDVGRTRDHNEDTFLVADLTRRVASLQPEVREHEVGARGSLFMVADGMGGAAAGEVASRMAADLVFTHMSQVWPEDSELSAQRFAYRMKEAVELANNRIHIHAREHPEVRGMGTTATVAGIFGSDLYLAQVGDSRAYLIRGGKITQITKDQSLMQRLVEAGEITEEEAEQSERRNIILQALGPDPRVKVDLTWQSLRRGDLLVLCSDGLSGQVKREEIAEQAVKTPDLMEFCARLIELANTRGGPDNITAIAARFSGPGLAEPDGGAEVGHQVYPLTEGEATTEPVPVYTGSPAPVPISQQPAQPRRLIYGLLALLLLAVAMFFLLGDR
ncbi:MAG TPA: Stp1/IreP family PP2C-type Ser/Thr phosphatase [Gemmatimonadales bacterium]|nr:Stp1/IreP family PP2C-type Ser/Thr phosphatase [Gemmatimonadales bacterium]